MDTLTKAPMQLKLAGAMLALAALLIALLTAGMVVSPTMAQTEDTSPRIGDNAKEYKPPYPCSEEVEPNASTAKLVRDGYYPVFEGFWDYEVGHLSNNFCPPQVVKETKYDPVAEKNVTTINRKDAKIHISETVFSIPDSYKVTVVDSDESNGNPDSVTGTKIDLAKYPFLRDVVSAVKRENDTEVFANNSLYWVQPDGTSPLRIGFSTVLLKEEDWNNPNGGDPVLFRFAAVHVLKDGTPEEAHVLGAHFFAFDPGETHDKPRWSNVETDPYDEVSMQTGQYKPMQFVFTKPGQYLVQAQVQGHVQHTPPTGASEKWKPVNSDKTITSPVQWYTFHVGSEADLGVTLESGDVSTTGGNSTVPVTVTATNSGPNDAENVEVELNLPPGLSAPATLPAGATSSGCGVIAWEIEKMASGASLTLSFNANVDNGATGNLTAIAKIRSTTFDTNVSNDVASVEVTLNGTNVRPPFFPGVSRIIVEHAVDGAHAGDPVVAVSPEGRVLSYSLTGTCSNKFRVHPNGQIVLAVGQTLDYEKQWEYPLTLHISDGVNASGDADPSIDDSTPVLIQVEDTEPGAVYPTVRFWLSKPDSESGLDLNYPKVGQTVDVNADVENLPLGVTATYTWENPAGIGGLPWHTEFYPASGIAPGDATYTVHVKWDGGGITASYTMTWYSDE